MKKKKLNIHFTIETRTIIENRLNENVSIPNIAKELQRDSSNIRKEINKHKTLTFPSSFNNHHPCIKHLDCPVKSFECYKFCKNIEINLCEKLISSPHVCNGCTSKQHCRRVKQYYKATDANSEYLNNWRKDRTGLHYTEDELNILNIDFKTLVLNTRSVYHSLIVINNRGYNFKLQTIYKQIERDQLDLKRYQLPRYRKTTKSEKDTSYKRKNIEGHTYEDYQIYKENNPNDLEVQIDTVEGIKENNSPFMLTLEIVKIKFIFIFKINAQTSVEVTQKLRYFKSILGKEIFTNIFKILLTDNGKEFYDIDEIINILEHSNLFYCHPYSGFEKGSIENNHELIRRVIPKGVSLKIYSQKDYDILCSHINSLYRESLDGMCPFDLVYDYIPKDILNELDLKKIEDSKVLLIPELLGNKNINNIKKYLNDKEIKEANILL